MPVSVAMTGMTQGPSQAPLWTLGDIFPVRLDRLGTPYFLCFWQQYRQQVAHSGAVQIGIHLCRTGEGRYGSRRGRLRLALVSPYTSSVWRAASGTEAPTGSISSPRSTILSLKGGSAVSKCISENRSSSVSNVILASRRASGAPRQW